MAPWNGSGDFSLSDTIAPATNADANELQAILTDIGVGIDASFAADGQSTMTAGIKGFDGTALLPGYSFSSDLNSGWYRIGADNIGLSLGGTKRVDFLTTGVSITGTLTASGQILSSDGTKTAPGYSFSGDVDTGIYRIGANNIGISCGDTKIADLTATSFGIVPDFSIATNKFTVAAASGNTGIAGTLNVTGLITGSHTTPTVQRLTSGTAATYTPPAGMTYIEVEMCGGGAGGGAFITNVGTTGNTTTFADWTAVGGGAGNVGAGAGGAGGTGGTDGTGTLIDRIAGGDGGAGAASGTAGVSNGGGQGGANPRGGAPRGGINANGQNGKANSGAGGGGSNNGSGTNASAGGGAGEWVKFRMTAAQVGASKTYTIGATAAGGVAGTRPGGDGAAGVAIVKEFYS